MVSWWRWRQGVAQPSLPLWSSTFGCTQAGFPEEWMSETFSHMTFGSGIVAILSGIVASFVRDAVTVVCVFECVLLF